METTFTPEPLYVYDSTSPIGNGFHGTFDIINQPNYGNGVKIMGDVKPYGGERFCTHEEAKAYAKLFAASPDMLKAIRLALNIKDLWAPVSDPGIEHEGEAQALQSMLNELEAAYKKATP